MDPPGDFLRSMVVILQLGMYKMANSDHRDAADKFISRKLIQPKFVLWRLGNIRP